MGVHELGLRKQHQLIRIDLVFIVVMPVSNVVRYATSESPPCPALPASGGRCAGVRKEGGL
jgi:hypothetical protein